MSETISWSASAGGPGGSVSAAGALTCDAMTLASVTIDGASNKVLAFQLEDVTKIVFLSIKSSLYENLVKIKIAGTGAKEIKLSGPVFLFGDAVALLGPSLDTLTVTNTDAAKAANVEVLIATKLT